MRKIKFLFLIVSLLGLFPLTSCGNDEPATSVSDELAGDDNNDDVINLPFDLDAERGEAIDKLLASSTFTPGGEEVYEILISTKVDETTKYVCGKILSVTPEIKDENRWAPRKNGLLIFKAQGLKIEEEKTYKFRIKEYSAPTHWQDKGALLTEANLFCFCTLEPCE